MKFPEGHRRRIRTNNMIERLNREIRRRTRVVGSFPDGKTARSCSSARASGTSPRTNGPTGVTWTCPGSMTTSRERTDHRAMDGHDPKCATFRVLPWFFSEFASAGSTLYTIRAPTSSLEFSFQGAKYMQDSAASA